MRHVHTDPSQPPCAPGPQWVPVVDELDRDELSMATTDLSRWDDPTYRVRIEEMDLFVKILNNISRTCHLKIWYAISPLISSHIASVLAKSEDIPVGHLVSLLLCFSLTHPIPPVI
jgi:hypothetical protein